MPEPSESFRTSLLGRARPSGRDWATIAGLIVTLLVPASSAAQRGDTAVTRQRSDTALTPRKALLSGEYERAISMLRAAVVRAPDAAPSRLLIRTLAEIGDYDAAIAEAHRFQRAKPGSAEVSATLGDILLLVGRRADAESSFARAIERRAPDSLSARLGLALIQRDKGDLKGARAAFDQFIDIYNRSRRLSAAELTAVASAVGSLAARDPNLAKDAVRAYGEAIIADSLDPEPSIRLGELLLERFNGTEAREVFEGVLARNPRHPRALLGMARTLRFEGSSQSMTGVERSLTVNGKSADTRAFKALLHLEAEEMEEAQREAERALAVNPASVDALAILATLQHLRDDSTAFQATVRRTLALYPAGASFFTTLAELTARHRRYDDAAGFARRAVQLDPLSWRGYALLGINQLRVGEVDSGRANLDRSFQGDPYDPWSKNTLDLLDNLARYPETKTPRFRFYVDAKESAALSLYLGELAEAAYDSLSRRYGYNPPTPIRVELFPNHADFSVRTVGLVGLGALGVSFGRVIAMDSPSSRDEGEFSWGSALWHELSHTFHLGMTENRVPRWFTEGLAVHEERRARQGWGDNVTPEFLAAYNQKRLHPVSELNNGFMRPAYPEQLLFSYYQASLVCELIEQQHGARALVRFLEGYRAGKTTTQLLKEVLGTNPADFDRTFDDYLKTRFAGPLAAIGSPKPPEQPPSREEIVARSADRGSYFAQMLMGQVLIEENDMDGAIPYLERAKALFPEYAGPDSPSWLLARAHQRRGDTRRAVVELKSLVARNSQHYPALVTLASLLETKGDTAGAADILERTIYVWPLDLEQHQRLATLVTAQRRWDRAIRERQAVLALNPVDRADALYQLARAYLNGGDIPNARRTVLQALERAPNFPAAQDLLLTIHEKKREN